MLTLRAFCAAALFLFASAAAFALPSPHATTGSYSHVPVLLPDGNMLLTGGMVDNVPTFIQGVSVIYDTGASSEGFCTANAFTQRSSHTATLLPNGLVLVAGGRNGVGYLNTTYLYNPITHLCAAGPTLTNARALHTATLLADGTVLFLGGVNAGGALSATEIYTPTADGSGTGSFALSTSLDLLSARYAHTATLMKSSGVFVAGGFNGTDYLSTTEVFRAFGNTLQRVAGPSIQGRASHSATLLNNGDVLLAGGYNQYASGEPQVLYTSERYSGETGTISPASNLTSGMPYGMAQHSAVLNTDGRVSLAGGVSAFAPITNPFGVTLNVDYEIRDSTLTATPYIGYTEGVISTDISTLTVTLALQKLPTDATGTLLEGKLLFTGEYIASLSGGLARINLNRVALDLAHQELYKGTFRPDPLLGNATAYMPALAPISFSTDTAKAVTMEDSDCTAVLATPLAISASRSIVVNCSISPKFWLDSSAYYMFDGLANPGAESLSRLNRVQFTFNTGAVSYTDGADLTASFAITPYQVLALTGQDWPLTYHNNTLFDTHPAAPLAWNNVSGIITNEGAAELPADTYSLTRFNGFSADVFYLINPFTLYGQKIEKKPDAPDGNLQFFESTTTKFLSADQFYYDPSLRSWSFHAFPMADEVTASNPLPPIYPRAMHSSTMFPSGTEHILYGMKADGAAADPISYFPSSTKYFLHRAVRPTLTSLTDATGRMSSSRINHTATLLPSGQVLVTGGNDAQITKITSDIYDSGQNNWSPTSSMSVSRTRHTANLLSMGNVFVAGGYSQHPSTGPTRSAEVYYPSSGQWRTTTSMVSARESHTSVYLTTGTYAGNIMVIGGYKDGTYLKECEIYNPITEIWLSTASTPAVGSMNVKRAKHTATTLPNGHVLVYGGVNETGSLYSAEVYNPVTNVWTSVTAAPDARHRRHSHRATMLNSGLILVTGGANESGPLSPTDYSDPTTGTSLLFNYDVGAYIGATGVKPGEWTLTSNDMSFDKATHAPGGRIGHTATLLPNGNVLIAGGSANNMPVVTTPELFDTFGSSFSYTVAPTIPRGQGHTSTVLPNGYVLFAGGLTNTGQYSNDGSIIYFSAVPDSQDLPSLRQSSGLTVSNSIYDKSTNLTLTSGNTNYFFGLTEASGGTNSGSAHYHPRVYATMMDNQSGYQIDLSTSIYNLYAGSALNSWSTMPWQIKLPPPTNLPYGWYHLRAASNGIFSSQAVPILISIPAPTGIVSGLASVTAALSTTSITWQWQRNTIKRKNIDTLDTGESASERYMILSSTDNALLTYLDIPAATDTASWAQSGLQPNTRMAIRVAGINISTSTRFLDSATVYTYANPPINLAISSASFNSLTFGWSPNSNTPTTPYEVGYCINNCNSLSASWNNTVSFEQNKSSTGATMNSLSTRKTYYVRVRAQNGAGIIPTETVRSSGVYEGYCCKYCLPEHKTAGRCVDGVDNSAYDQYKGWVSTTTISYPGDIAGATTSYNSITWTWTKPALGTETHFDIKDAADTFLARVPVSPITITTFSYTQSTQGGEPLVPNTSYYAFIRSVVDQDDDGAAEEVGEYVQTPYAYTLAQKPAASSDLQVTTGSITVYWTAPLNPSQTEYRVLSILNGVTSYYQLTQQAGQVVVPYTLINLKPNTMYAVKVYSANLEGNPANPVDSDYLVLTTGTYTLPSAPANLTAASVGASRISLSWEANNNPAGTKYKILAARRIPPSTDFETQQTLIGPSDNLILTTYTVTGLLTNTDYRFYVTAMNSNNMDSPQASLTGGYVTTLGGAAGTKVGYVSGLVSEGVITGTLPDNRTVTITVPSSAYEDSATQIAFGISATSNPCLQTSVAPQVALPVFEVLTSSAAQPKVPITVKFKYAYTDASGNPHDDLVGRDITAIALARAVATGNCLPLKTSISSSAKEVTATLNHFSDFQLIVPGTATNLEGVRIYPNPLFPNQGQIYMYFDNLPAGTKIRLYTLSGVKAWEGEKNGVSPITWDGRNSSGEKMASGVYLAVLEGGGEKKIFKVAMER